MGHKGVAVAAKVSGIDQEGGEPLQDQGIKEPGDNEPTKDKEPEKENPTRVHRRPSKGDGGRQRRPSSRCHGARGYH